MRNLKIFSWRVSALCLFVTMSAMLLSFNKDPKSKNYTSKVEENSIVLYTLSQKVEQRGNCPPTLIHGCSKEAILVVCEGQYIQQKKRIQNNF